MLNKKNNMLILIFIMLIFVFFNKLLFALPPTTGPNYNIDTPYQDDHELGNNMVGRIIFDPFGLKLIEGKTPLPPGKMDEDANNVFLLGHTFDDYYNNYLSKYESNDIFLYKPPYCIIGGPYISYEYYQCMNTGEHAAFKILYYCRSTLDLLKKVMIPDEWVNDHLIIYCGDGSDIYNSFETFDIYLGGRNLNIYKGCIVKNLDKNQNNTILMGYDVGNPFVDSNKTWYFNYSEMNRLANIFSVREDEFSNYVDESSSFIAGGHDVYLRLSKVEYVNTFYNFSDVEINDWCNKGDDNVKRYCTFIKEGCENEISDPGSTSCSIPLKSKYTEFIRGSNNDVKISTENVLVHKICEGWEGGFEIGCTPFGNGPCCDWDEVYYNNDVYDFYFESLLFDSITDSDHFEINWKNRVYKYRYFRGDALHFIYEGNYSNFIKLEDTNIIDFNNIEYEYPRFIFLNIDNKNNKVAYGYDKPLVKFSGEFDSIKFPQSPVYIIDLTDFGFNKNICVKTLKSKNPGQSINEIKNKGIVCGGDGKIYINRVKYEKDEVNGLDKNPTKTYSTFMNIMFSVFS